MKTCFKCGACKPLTDFYRHKQMADGHLNKCKECAKRDTSESRHVKHRERVLQYDRERAKRPERAAASRAVARRWTEEHPERRTAQLALGNAVRDGRVIKWPACAVPECDSTSPVAHHPDYSQPLDVVWLCQAHHQQAHALSRLIHSSNVN